MLTFAGKKQRLCDRVSRREFFHVGALGAAGLTLADLLRLQARGAATARPKTVIMIVQTGGPSHIDIYDLKPDAPAEIRGEFKPIQTKVPGLDICELLPMQAKLADRFSVVRNLQMAARDHTSYENVTGFYPPGTLSPAVREQYRPAFGSVLSALGRGAENLPAYVSLRADAFGGHEEYPAFLGTAHRPFFPTGPALENLKLHSSVTPERLTDRRELLRSFDGLRRDLDGQRGLAGLDAFQARAFDLIASNKARDAFDVNKEPDKVRDRYGPCLRLLQALRLAEAGVALVTVEAPVHAGTWDHCHFGNFDKLRKSLPLLDRFVSALLEDIHERGLENDVVLLMWGEFGRTPVINKGGGRDHWPQANYAWFAGGGLRMGQAIGATDARGQRPAGARYSPQNVLATLYHVLGIDLAATTIPDRSGRPMYLLDDPKPIAELV